MTTLALSFCRSSCAPTARWRAVAVNVFQLPWAQTVGKQRRWAQRVKAAPTSCTRAGHHLFYGCSRHADNQIAVFDLAALQVAGYWTTAHCQLSLEGVIVQRDQSQLNAEILLCGSAPQVVEICVPVQAASFGKSSLGVTRSEGIGNDTVRLSCSLRSSAVADHGETA